LLVPLARFHIKELKGVQIYKNTQLSNLKKKSTYSSDEPGHIELCEKKFSNGGKRHVHQQCNKRYKSKVVKLIELRGYLFTVPTYKFEISAATLITNNRVLRRIFGPKRDEVMGEWRKLHNEELNDLYCSPNIVRVIKSRRMGWVGHVAHMGEGRGVYRILVGKSERGRPLGRLRHRWEDNIRMDLQEVVCGGMEWIGRGGRLV